MPTINMVLFAGIQRPTSEGIGIYHHSVVVLACTVHLSIPSDIPVPSNNRSSILK
jgi:hypothetical protein